MTDEFVPGEETRLAGVVDRAVSALEWLRAGERP